jgi:hypothetical protein
MVIAASASSQSAAATGPRAARAESLASVALRPPPFDLV